MNIQIQVFFDDKYPGMVNIYLNEFYKWGIGALEKMNDLWSSQVHIASQRWIWALHLVGLTPKCLRFESFLEGSCTQES